MFEYTISGAILSVKVATSLKKDGSFRFREVSGIGGNPEGARGSDVHYSKLEGLAEHMSSTTGDDWELTDLVYIIKPRQYYGRLSNGVDELLYQYITTDAPGSGQQYIFSPHVSKKRVPMQFYHAAMGAMMIKHKFGMDYNDIPWKDRDIMVDIINQGVNPDMIETTLQLMR